MEQLIKYIAHYYDSKIVSTDLSIEEQEELSFLEDFLSDFDLKDLGSMINIDRAQLVTAFLAGRGEEILFSEIKMCADQLDYKKIIDFHDVFTINEYLVNSLEKESYIFFMRLPFDFDKDDENARILEDMGELDNAIELQNLLRKYFTDDEKARKAFFNLYTKYGRHFILALVSVALLNENQMKYQSYPIDEDQLENDSLPLNTFDINDTDSEWLRLHILSMLEACHLKEYFADIKKRRDTLNNLPREREKKNKSMRRKKEKITSTLLSLDESKPIALKRNFIESINEETIKYYILRRALKINMKFHESTIEELQKEERTSTLEKLFKKSCFSFDDLTDTEKVNLSIYGNISDIEKMLELFTESEIKIYHDSFPIYDVLMLSKPSIVADINKLIKAGVIDENFVLRNPSVFIQSIDENILDKVNIKDANYELFISNINLFKERKLDTKTISKFRGNILLGDNDRNASILDLVDLYSLDYSKSNNFSLMIDPKLISIVDRYIELGLGDYIKKHPYLINERSKFYLDRLEICKQLDIPLIIDGKLNPKVTQKEFKIGKNIIGSLDISNYIPNSVNRYADLEMFKVLLQSDSIITKFKDIPEFEKFKLNDMEYNFGGIIISRLKVLRNYTILSEMFPDDDKKVLFNSIIFGSVLDDEQLDLISSELDQDKNKEKMLGV